jgi:glycosyltransferase involved in cell wall biosynthesis
MSSKTPIILETANTKMAICAIVKDEAPYLAEWIEHHKLIGFDYILLYNDGSTDDTQCVLDAYAEKSDVTRIPEDIGSEYMKDLPWLHSGQIPNNPQQAIFEVCRRYLVDEELKRDVVGSTWMLTTDVDEFLWFDIQFGDARSALVAMISKLRSNQSDVRSARIPYRLFGSSGKESYEDGLVMERFVHRSGDDHCSQIPIGKSFSHVTSIFTCANPEHHILIGTGKLVKDALAIEEYLQLAHYKTKSRME